MTLPNLGQYATPTHNGGSATGSTIVYAPGQPVNVAKNAARSFKAVAYKAGMSDSAFTTFDADNNVGTRESEQGDEDVEGTGTQPLYDFNGNLMEMPGPDGGTWDYEYDGKNRLVSASHGQQAYVFNYDAKNRCVSRSLWVQEGSLTQAHWDCANATYYYYDGWDLIEERDGSGIVTASYVHGAHEDELISQTNGYGTFYYQADAEGSVVALTDGSGNVIERYTYDVYGAVKIYNSVGQPLNSAFSSYGNRFLFTGREYLPDLGLYDYRNRVYSPELGRFLQTDPKSFDADPSNLYRYCHNDPVDHTDPLGLDFGPFDTADGAMAFTDAKFHPEAQHSNREFALDMYKYDKSGHYYVNDPKWGHDHGATSSKQIPKGAHVVGHIHDHGHYGHMDPLPPHRVTPTTREHDNMRSDNPSVTIDEPFWKKQANGKKEYHGAVIGPSGKLTEQNQSGKQREVNVNQSKEKDVKEYQHLNASDIEKKEEAEKGPSGGASDLLRRKDSK